ncbi:MAG: PD40 domain-containing protein [Candidatus Harrisonbacteria bacterium]|nr:PD40 domain-containing protein [Candidatus Harrisonbacteria bacterium]
MTERTKKILIIVLFVIFVGLMAWLLYRVFFFRGAPDEVSPPISPEAPEEVTTLPTSGAGGARIPEKKPKAPELPVSPVAAGGITAVTPLTLTPTKAPVLAANGTSLNYYDPADGKFYTIDRDGNTRALLRDAFPKADKITWNTDADKAIVEFPDGANVIVDFRSQDVVTLPQHWEDFDFSPAGKQIAAKSIGTDPGNRWLIVASPDGSRAETVAALGQNANKVDVRWSPNDQVIAFSDTGITLSGFGRKQILPIGKNQENFPGLVVEGLSFNPLWSKDGKQILYSTAGPTSNYQPQVWLVDGEANTMGQNRRSLPLNTWADKCTFANDTTAYCAVPQSLPPGSGLQRQLASGVPDSLYRIDTKTGAMSLVVVPDGKIPMKGLTVSKDGGTLFYQHEINGALGTIRLK